MIPRLTPTRVQWILQVNCIHATQKSHETSQLWDQENGQETGVRICDKVIPTHMCLYCILCIGIICSSHWSTDKTTHVKLLSYHTLVLYWAHSLRPMKQPMESHRFATHWHYMRFTFVGPWNCPCKASVLPNIRIKPKPMPTITMKPIVGPIDVCKLNLHEITFCETSFLVISCKLSLMIDGISGSELLYGDCRKALQIRAPEE